MAKKCADCPFACKGKGLALRKSLAKGRWKEILHGLRNNLHFTCHQTIEETGKNNLKLMCAGAIEWQNERGLSSNLQRVMERIAA